MTGFREVFVSMKNNRTPNYGLDAPVAVRNMLIVGALGIISLVTRLLGVWSRQDAIAVIARPSAARSMLSREPGTINRWRCGLFSRMCRRL